MLKAPADLKHLLLDLMVDGQSSFAGLFGALREHYDYPPTSTSVAIAFDTLTEMVDIGWARLKLTTTTGTFTNATEGDIQAARSRYSEWLPGATFDERTIDEIGLWFEITKRGRTEWAQWSKVSENAPARWALDDDNLLQIVTIRAASISDAEDALGTWTVRHPRSKLLYKTKEVSPLAKCTLRSGAVIADGITLKCRYETAGPKVAEVTNSK